MPANLEEDAVVTQQTTLEQRRQQAHETAARLGLTMPLLLDEMDNAAERRLRRLARAPRRRRIRRPDRLPGQPRPVGLLARGGGASSSPHSSA